MPPKKKVAKAAVAESNVTNEPPQPPPGSPYCLSLALEVCLDAAELIVAAPDAANADTPQLTESGEQEASRDERIPLLVEPVFRYTFVNGENITTPPVGQPGSSWMKLQPGDEQAASGDPSTAASLAEEAKTQTREQQECGDAPLKPALWRYTRVHQLQGEDDEEVAMSLDRKPMMQITLADKSSRQATAQPQGPGIKGHTKNGISAIPGRNFIESWPLDLSPFLAGESSVTIYVGGVHINKNEEATPEDGCPVKSINSSRDKLHDSKKNDAPAAPEGIHQMRVCVSLHGAVATDGDLAQEPEEIKTQTDAREDTPMRATSCPKLLSTKTMEWLNPLSINITSAASLPGVRIEAESLQYHVNPSQFRLLETHCKPVYVVCRPFPDDPLGASLHSRVILTAGSAQKKRARFDHTSSFLVGLMDRHRLEEWVETSTLSVEVHDRDPFPSARERRENVIRLERMVAGGYPVEDGGCDSSVGGHISKNEGNREGPSKGDEAASVSYAGPKDIYEVDGRHLNEVIARAESAGKDNAHGVATFRISGLLDQSRQLALAYSNRKSKDMDSKSAAHVSDEAPRLRIRSEICQRKRKEIPKGGVEDWHLSDGERFVRWPGAYLDAGSSLGIRLSLARPLRTLEEGSAERTGPATEGPRPFSRAVFVVEYEGGGGLLRATTAAMDQINQRALKDTQGSLRTYRFTPEERQAVDDGTLNVVCGFMTIDEDSRTLVLEGTAGPHGGLTALLRRVSRVGPNGQTYRVLENPDVRFSRRLYSCFDADLKKVRLRDPLPILCRNPEIYDRSKVSAGCFNALHCLQMLRKVDRIKEAAEQALFPEASQLIQVESKYGESISVKDITGQSPVKNKRSKTVGEGAQTIISSRGRSAKVDGQEKTNEGVNEAHNEAPLRRKAPTDSTNLAFEEWLRGRRWRDFLAEQGELLARNHQEFLERQRRREEELQAETVATEWCYGPQKLNYVELKKAEMRERLAKDKGATYTYSMDYVSQTVSLVDESRLKEDQEAQSKAAWKTKRGFVWPCPRTRQELITHPSKPSESRIDTLKEPWIENELYGGGVDEATGGGGGGIPPNLTWRRKFDTVPSNGKAVFGGLKPSKYERLLNTDLIGGRSLLPRGLQQLEKDPEFFRSVHLVGEGLEREKEETKRRIEELWQSKVIVDDTDFRVGNFSVRDTPLQVDRAKDILHLPTKKTAFKMIRNARLPSGKRALLRPPPISTFSQEPFVEPEDFTVSIRGNHRERWAATDSETGEKADFYLRLHGDRMKPRSQKSCARRKHPPLILSEMQGPRWGDGRKKKNQTVAVQESGGAC